MDMNIWNSETNPHPDHKDRMTGRSYRTCLRAVLAASEKPDQKIVIVFPTRAVGRAHIQTLKGILSRIDGSTFFVNGAQLPNGSQIIMSYTDDSRLVGLQCQIFYDHVFP